MSTLYQDPDAPRVRPSLVGDLMRLPATPEQHPLENQATATLAWLADRSDLFARRFVALFVDDPVPDGAVGARDQISLPMPEGNTLRPDLSIDGPNGSLQLLFEVKITAQLAYYEGPDGVVRRQDEQYRWGWQHLEHPEGRVRAVGTLTLDPPDTLPADPGELRARHVTWHQVRDMLEEVLPEMGEDVRLVAASFLDVLRTRIAVQLPDPEQLTAWLADNEQLVVAVSERLAERIPGSKTTTAKGAWFTGRRVHIPDVHGAELRLRVYITPAGGKQNIAGHPDSLIIGLERNAGGFLEESLHATAAIAGFPRSRDLAGDVMHRAVWPLEEAARDAHGFADGLLDALAPLIGEFPIGPTGDPVIDHALQYVDPSGLLADYAGRLVSVSGIDGAIDTFERAAARAPHYDVLPYLVDQLRRGAIRGT